MVNCIETDRTACAIGGAYTALAIGGVLPVLHCGNGCMEQFSRLLGSCNGAQTNVPYEDSLIPCSDFCEADVVFGGSERFRTLIEKCIEVYDPKLIIAADGCVAEIVGDDIEEVANSFSGSPIPVIHAKLPGFQGNNLFGHSVILNAIIDQYLKPTGKKNPKQVNVFGIVPFFDPMWLGTLERIEELLTRFGLEPNIIYGRNKGIAEVDKIPEAAFNLLLSPWIDLDVVQKLEEEYDIPYFQYPCVPYGPGETEKFLRELQKYANLDADEVERYIAEEDDRYFYYIKRHMMYVFACNVPPKKFYYIGSASNAVSITRYAVNDLGLTPQKIYITDNVPEESQEAIREYLYDVKLESKDFDIIFTEDGGKAQHEILDSGVPGDETVIFGSSWDEPFALQLDAGFVPVVIPYGYQIIADKNYFGYRGGLQLFADIYNSTESCTWFQL